jgi:hypothetical protein
MSLAVLSDWGERVANNTAVSIVKGIKCGVSYKDRKVQQSCLNPQVFES